MSSDSDRFLKEDLERLRRQKGFCPLTPQEADAELRTAADNPLSDAEIRSILDQVTSGSLAESELSPDLDWAGSLDTAPVEENVFQLNRNKGESDPETDTLQDELRKKALEKHGKKKPTGMDGGPEPSGEGG